MPKEYNMAFEGTREMAINAKQNVLQELLLLEEKGDKDSHRRQIQLALSVLRSMCSVVTKPEGQHHDVYCDTLVNVLAKHIHPSAGAKYWTMYLEHVRYLHHLVADKKLFTEAKMLCDLVTSYPDYIHSEGDYKVVLGMFFQHLLCQHGHIRLNSDLAQEHIGSILNASKELFEQMLHCHKKYNFIYKELISDFVQYLVPKRVSTVFNFLAALPANKTIMFDAFFTLLKDIRTPESTKQELQAHCQRHIEALAVFLQLDVSDRLQQQLALRHLRACRDISVFANDKSSNYVFSLLYYLVKLIYGLPNPGDFKDIYKDLCVKLTTFFDRYGEMLMQERWFTDVPVVIAVILTHLQKHATTPFAFFWQHMNSIECYITHFELILSCLRLAPRIVETKLLKFDCCTSARKHTIISLVLSALSAYSSYALSVDDSKAAFEELFVSLRTQLLLVIRHGVSVLDSLACITPESTELKMIYARFIQLTVDMRTPPQIQLCITLAELMLRVRHQFSIKDWTLLLRRLYKMTLKTNDASLSTELHVAHIASMLQECAWPDFSVLRNRIGHFHTTTSQVPPGNCILQVALQSHSPFKVFLDTPQKQILHWLETEQFLKYHKSNEQLQMALMQCSPTLYAEVLVARGGGALKAAVASRLRKIRKELELKRENTAGLTRVEFLCLAHVSTALLHEALKLQKEALTVEIKCQEDTLEELLQRKELSSVTVATETKFVNQAATALEGFKKFYELADLEPVASHELCIDWEAIMEDVTSLALYLQLSGYLDLATDAWILQFRIANTINDEYNALRGLTYFCEHSEYFSTNEKGIDLSEEVANKQNFLFGAMEQLPKLAKRFQNYVLMCLCQLANYYARNGHFGYAEILLEFVQNEHAELPNQQGKYNVVLGTVDVVKFRILWKHLNSEQHLKATQLSQLSMLREMENTLERFRGDFFKLSSSELMSYTILLLSLIEQVAECAANRLCDHFVNSYFAGTFKLLLQSGSALRLVQMLAMWAWINLQMEYVKKAQIKTKLMEYILGVKNLEDLRQMSEDAAAEKKLAATNSFTTLELLHSGMEPLRKMMPPHESPIKTVKMQLSPSMRGEIGLKRYLRVRCNDAQQQHEILQWWSFMVGCLNARLYFLADNHENLEDFYDTSQHWLEKHQQNTLLHISFQNVQLLSLQHYINYLRTHKKYEKALSCLNAALISCNGMRGNVDSIYQINFLLQLYATKREMSLKKDSRQRAGLRRALAFNVSPDLNKPEGECMLSVVAVAPASTRKKLTAPAFKIYGTDGHTPEHTPKRTVAVGSSAVCKTNEKRAQPVTVRKTRHRLVAEAESQTPANVANVANNKTISKTFTARKLRELRAVHDSRSSSPNSTPETDTDNILNQSQRIESIDVLDSEDTNSIHNAMPNSIRNEKTKKASARKANKRCENILNICQRIDSIDLQDHDEPILVASKCSTSTPQLEENQVNTQEIIDISDDTIGFETPDSTFGQLTAPLKTSNAKNIDKKAPRSTKAKRRSKETISNNASNGVGTGSTFGEASTAISSEPQVQIVEKKTTTMDTIATTTKTKTRTKTEVRTIKVISKETEIRIVSPTATTKGSTTRGRPRATQKVSSKNNDENVAPSAIVSRTLSRRARQ